MGNHGQDAHATEKSTVNRASESGTGVSPVGEHGQDAHAAEKSPVNRASRSGTGVSPVGDHGQDAHATDGRHLSAVLEKAQVVVLAMLFVLLFVAVLMAPRYMLGVRCVTVVSGLLALVAAQRVWLRGSARRAWTGFLFFCLFLFGVNAFVTAIRDLDHWGMVVGHDQPQYYAYLHSWVFDRDMHFENEYSAIPGTLNLMAESHAGQPGYNVAPVGTAILWLPFYLVGHGAVSVVRVLGADLEPDGISTPYAMAAAFGSLVLAWLGLVLVNEVARRHVSSRSALFATVLVAVASPLPWYLTELPWMSHAASFFAAALVLWCWDRTRDERTLAGWAALGAAIGLAMLVRPSHFVLLVFPIADAVVATRSGKRGLAWGGLGLCVLAMLAAFSPQVLTWLAQYGFAYPPGSPMRWTSPAIIEVLFSAHHGLFPWHPILLLGFLGIPLIWRRSRRLAVTLAIVLAAYVYTNAAIEAWFAGGSFGMRRFVGALPVLAIGIAAFGSWGVGQLRKRPGIAATALVIGLAVYNGLLVAQVRTGWTGTLRPESFQDVWSKTAVLFHERFGNPFTYPAGLWFGLKHGVSPGQFDIVTGVEPTAELEVAGIGVRPYLGRGWYSSKYMLGVLEDYAFAQGRQSELLIPLRPHQNYTIELTVSAPGGLTQGQTVTYAVNGTDLGALELEPPETHALTMSVPANLVKDGVNIITLTYADVYVKRFAAPAPDNPGRGLEVHTRQPLRVPLKLWKIRVELSD